MIVQNTLRTIVQKQSLRKANSTKSSSLSRLNWSFFLGEKDSYFASWNKNRLTEFKLFSKPNSVMKCLSFLLWKIGGDPGSEHLENQQLGFLEKGTIWLEIIKLDFENRIFFIVSMLEIPEYKTS